MATKTIYTCDVQKLSGHACEKEVKSIEDGIILTGHIKDPSGKVLHQSSDSHGPEPKVICWGCFGSPSRFLIQTKRTP